MKRLLITFSLLLTFGLSTSGVAAQVQAPDLGEIPGMEDIQGLVSVYDRTFSMDMEALLASPDVDFSTMDTSEMFKSISITGYTFENNDDAERYMNEMRDQANNDIDELTTELEDGQQVELNDDIDAVDKNGMTATLVMDIDEETSIASTIHAFVDGSQVFVVTATDSDLDASGTTADSVAQHIVDAESDSDDVTFREDGTSTGGVFDRMPQSGDEIVGDLTASDLELYVAE